MKCEIMDNNLKEILATVQACSYEGNRKGLISALRALLDKRREYYKLCTEESLYDGFSDALYKILLLELDEEEEESIEIAELAYLSLGTLLKNEAANPELYKRRLLLLHYFADFFTDSIIEVFLSRYRTDNILEARNLAVECLEKMQLSDMFYLEENETEFIDGDEQLADACNDITADPDISEEERGNAALLHKVLYAYLKAKYKN